MTPREDLREGKPLDASEFAVHLDDVRNNCAPADYQKPDRFFARTYLTKNLGALSAEVVRRLSGIRTETNAVFNLATQFGGGKTHALTLLFHLTRNWPAMTEWPTKAIRDAFYASPKFPRIVGPDVVRDTISRGVGNGQFAYVGKTAAGDYRPFHFNVGIMTGEIEFSEDMFLIKKETAEEYLERKKKPAAEPTDEKPPKDVREREEPGEAEPGRQDPKPKPPRETTVAGMAWEGEIPPQKWMNFYTKVLAKFAGGKGLRLNVAFDVRPDGGLSPEKIEETKAALRELGLDPGVTTDE